MGYLYLGLALAGGLIKGFAGKRISKEVLTFRDCLLANLLRFLFCAVFSAVLLWINGESFDFSLENLPFYLFSAVCMDAYCITFMYGYKTTAYMFLSIFGMLGSAITALLGHFIYSESLSPGKIAGMVLLVGAVAVMSKYNKKVTLTDTARLLPLLILATVSVALSDFTQKVYAYEIGGSAGIYNFNTYAYAAVLVLIALLGTNLCAGKQAVMPVWNKYFLLYPATAGAQFLNSFSKTLAAKTLPAAEIYPVLQGANLIASAVLASVLLKEPISKRCILGMALAFAGILLMKLC